MAGLRKKLIAKQKFCCKENGLLRNQQRAEVMLRIQQRYQTKNRARPAAIAAQTTIAAGRAAQLAVGQHIWQIKCQMAGVAWYLLFV